jgi:hypothetical protein
MNDADMVAPKNLPVPLFSKEGFESRDETSPFEKAKLWKNCEVASEVRKSPLTPLL